MGQAVRSSSARAEDPDGVDRPARVSQRHEKDMVDMQGGKTSRSFKLKMVISRRR